MWFQKLLQFSVESDSSSGGTASNPSYQNVEVRKAHFRYGDKVKASRRSKREKETDVYQNVSFDCSAAYSSDGPMSLPPSIAMSNRDGQKDGP